MNQELGTVITGIVTDKNEKHTYIQKSGVTYEVVEEVSAELGDTVEGFAYTDRNDNYKVTTNPPEAQAAAYGWGTVVETRRDLGVFVDIGLPDKDIVVSLDDLPSEHSIWPKAGDKLLVRLSIDNQERMWAKLAEESQFTARSRKADKGVLNDDVTGTVYAAKLVGTYVITEENYLGFIHPSERQREPRLGEVVSGRIIDTHKDGSVNISLLPRAYETLEQDAAMIYEILVRTPGRKIPYTDKSNPDDIREFFGISKAQFKRSVGRLMKLGVAKQEDGYTHLIKEID